MPDMLIDAHGEPVDPNSIRGRQSRADQDRIDQIIRRESELGAYDLEDVRELGKHTI